MNTQHVVPVDDIIEHDTSSSDADCICGPDTDVVLADDNPIGWIIVHHSLDGRELKE